MTSTKTAEAVGTKTATAVGTSTAEAVTRAREVDPAQGPALPRSLTLVFDEQCEFCRRCQRWLSGQSTHLPLHFLAAGDPAAQTRYGNRADFGKELLVVVDDGRIWSGPDAFLMAMWATRRFRHMAHRLTRPGLAPLTERFFIAISSGRGSISSLLTAWSRQNRFGDVMAAPPSAGPEPGPCSSGTCGPPQHTQTPANRQPPPPHPDAIPYRG